MKSWSWNEFTLLLCYQRTSIHPSCSPVLERKHPMKYMPEPTQYISLHFLILSPLLMTSGPFLSNPLCSDTPIAQTWLPISYRNKLCSVTMDIAYPVRKTQKQLSIVKKMKTFLFPFSDPIPTDTRAAIFLIWGNMTTWEKITRWNITVTLSNTFLFPLL